MPIAANRVALAGAMLAATLSSLAASADSGDLKPLNRIDPEFPREAAVAGAESGLVKARMTIDASGEVTRVEILDARPRRVFDRAVVKTLSQWRFATGSSGREKDVEIEFKLK
jgi:protein TonB